MGSKVTFLTLLSFLLAISAMAREIPPFEGWSQISTDHFTFVYEPRDKDSAHHLASMAETIYDRVASFLGSYPKKLYCVVNGRSDIYENYFHPFRIVSKICGQVLAREACQVHDTRQFAWRRRF